MRRRGIRYPALTSLLDVLFLLLFAALVQSAALVEDAGAGPQSEAVAVADPVVIDAGPADAGPIDAAVADDRPIVDRALVRAQRALRHKTPIVVRLGQNTVTGVERVDLSGQVERIPFLVDLLEPSTDPDVVIEYRGHADPQRRICNLVPQAFPDLAMQDALVIIAPPVAIDSLPVALVKGMMADVRHCAAQGVTAVIEPDQTTEPSEDSHDR